jgi:hypothetical protein
VDKEGEYAYGHAPKYRPKELIPNTPKFPDYIHKIRRHQPDETGKTDDPGIRRHLEIAVMGVASLPALPLVIS